MKKREVIAVTPSVNVLAAGACIIEPHHVVCMAGPKNIADELSRFIQEKNVSRLLIFQETEFKTEVWTQLEELVKTGTIVEIFTTERYAKPVPLKQAKIAGTILHSGKDIFEALGRAFPKRVKDNQLIKACKANDENLIDFISYKKTRFFMSNILSDDLKDAMLLMKKFCKKPFSLETIHKGIAAAVSHFRESDFPFLEGKSAAIQELKKDIIGVARHDLNVLLIGETGTGKEAAAFFVHDFSDRAGRPFVSINCAALSEELLRSELFGHVKGAFTGATDNKTGLVKTAQGGTIFLDEFGDMSLPIQADLLRFLQTRKFRPLGSANEESAEVRIIAAAQPNLKEKIKLGKFRPDLFYRVAEVELNCPALREVPDDLIRVIRHLLYQIFFKQTRANYSKSKAEEYVSRINIKAEIDYFEKELDFLKSYEWPGNVRELFNIVKRHAYLEIDVIEKLKSEALLKSNSGEDSLNCFLSGMYEIAPLSDIACQYVKAVRQKWLSLPQKTLASKLKISENTLKKYLKH